MRRYDKFRAVIAAAVLAVVISSVCVCACLDGCAVLTVTGNTVSHRRAVDILCGIT
jgi:hypothetical protein